MRKIYRLGVLLFFFCLAAPMAGLAAGFKDVSKLYTFYDEVNFLSSQQIITGYSEGIFKPDLQVTRAEAAIMIGRALGFDDIPRDTKFNDVTANVTGSGYIASAVEMGIITGYHDNTYRPYEHVTRGQMAIFIDRAFELLDSNQSNKFHDISPRMKAYQSILNIHALGIANGYSDNTYRPDITVTRGQFSAFLARALEPSFRGALTFAVESVSGWEEGSSIVETDIDTEWVIKFNDEVDWQRLYKHIYVVRESNQQVHYIHPIIDYNHPQSVKLLLGQLYEFDETYTLYITEDVQSTSGNPLSEPVRIKFHTNKPEFDVEKSVEQDGVKFDIMLDLTDEKVFAKVKATNITSGPIPYVGFSGCDPGISAGLSTESVDGSVKTGSKWRLSGSCTPEVPQYSLQPGASIEVVEVLYPPEQPAGKNLYVKVRFQRGTSESHSTFNPIDISLSFQKNE
ncbi:S-layer homology domain-containing protein [Niallia endozanthoxylica]|uniref:S-layer homology domain-containing protein n=1 Tax=Niallia endozanthoxylica TaxID=2036016 RepID=UPI00168B5E49|nr:S-layer homology domain-containing protein [Niallia endozanthoxylica]